MRLQTRIQRELKFLGGLVRTLLRVRTIRPDSTHLVCDDIEAAVDVWRERRAITMGPRTITYGELDEIANRYAHWAMEHGIRRGETVVLYAPNRIDYLSIWYGLSKIGVGTAPIKQSQLTADRLEAAIRQTLTDQALRDNAERLGAKIRAEDGATRAAELIEQMAAR